MCAIDALAKVDYPDARVGTRFKKYIRRRLKELEAHADEIYNAFRCGIVHEARAKEGAELSLENNVTVMPDPGNSGIELNPKLLVENVRSALRSQMLEIAGDPEKAHAFKIYLLEQFSVELTAVNTD